MSKPETIKLGLNGKKLIEGTADATPYTIRVDIIHGQQVEVKVYDNPHLANQCEAGQQQMYLKGRY